ncbi:MAG: fibrinogen-like YCDxxxxGGGW domain-containing protein [Cryobacterium sp.]
MPSTTTPEDRSALRRLAALIAAGAVLASLLVPSAANAALPAPDGLTAATAAASCWEVKQVTPAAPSGVYWLVTPALGAPEQFYCDQSTSGGGWVLVGRGREGWSVSNEGAGTLASVRSPITGTGAFSPQQLSARVIGALLNGAAVSSLPDGVRLRRATNTDGTSWQEATFTFSSPRVDWSWAFDNEQRVGAWKIGAATGTGGMTWGFGSGDGLERIEAIARQPQGWQAGFGFGSASRGTTSSTSYLWAPSTTAPNPRPFTQMYLRPKLLSSGVFSTIPDTGTAKVQIAPVAESMALPTAWGVNGLGAGPSTLIEGSNEVSAFAEGNGIVYVGGNFLTVQRTSTGAGAVAQPYLAAFDVQTGELVPSFRPVFDNQIKSLAVLPNGRLAVGGYFTNVNGAARPGFVVLNPATGATDAGYSTRVYNNISGGVLAIRSLDVQGNWLYLGGGFTHMTGGTATAQTYMRAGGRISVTNGTPDATWNPEFNGTVISVDASAKGDRAYFAGYFTTSKTTPAVKAAVIGTASATVTPWTVDFSSPTNYQQTVKEVGGKVWLGGSNHMLFSYDRATMTELSTNITKVGGDFQAISSDGSVVYAGCHCFYANYSGAKKYPVIGTAWTQASPINSAGAWDNATGKYIPQFSPMLSQREGAGAWALFNDSTGTTWFGGDFTKSVRGGFVSQWSGGFVRFARNDAQAPTTPSALTATATAQGDALSWGGSTDNRGSVSYQVLRNDRVIASTTGRTATVPIAPAGTKYFVRAVDPSGNWSASTAAVTASTVAPPPDPNNTTLIAAGSSWSYYYSATDPAPGWQAPGYTAAGWATGAAPLGWGHATLGTTLTAADPKPLTSYYRTSFTVLDASAIASVALTTRADDGIVVYVNGKEVLRKNIADVIVTSGTYATTAVSAANAVANPVSVTVPGSAFVTGANVITAEVHSDYRATPSHSFELGAEATFGTQPEPAPAPDPGPGPAPDPAGTVMVAPASTWSYYFDANDPAPGWQAPAYAAAGWATGAAPLGWGHAELGTTLTAANPKPLTSYYRKSFTVSDATTIASVALTTRADDGIVVYVNGNEVLRKNIADATVTSGTYATESISATKVLANPVTVTVPGSAFVTGANVITAEVHSGYRATPSHSFELGAEATLGTQPEPTPGADPIPEPGSVPAGTVMVAPASTWSYYYEATDPSPEWNTTGFDLSPWKTGRAPLGWGQASIGTTLAATDPKPLTSYYRRSFTVEDPARISSLEFTTRADDGIVLYLNGAELTRANLPAGPVTSGTYATISPSVRNPSDPVVVQVPGSSLLAGTNVITAEVHSGYRATPSHSFELSAIVT